MSVDKCGICNHERREEIEAHGAQALAKNISWREASRRAGLAHYTSLKNHMERQNHYASPIAPTAVPLDPILRDAASGLILKMESAPEELKPLYAVAIKNVLGLSETKPSQTNLINAIKAINEVTGMKIEQQLMIEFAREAFGEFEGDDTPELPEGVFIDLASEELSA